MNSAVFAAYAGNPVLRSGSDDIDLLDSVLATGAGENMTDGLLNPIISNDVRTLVDMHDHGKIQAFEVKDTSYKALLGLARYLGEVLGKTRRNGLSPELLAQAVKFVKSVPAEQVFMRLEVTSKKPDVPDFNPAHMCAYDAERAHGTDYLQIARRLTIHGSSSSVMNNTDLGAFLESGRKKSVVLYLGTQKNDDVQFLDPAHAMALDLVVSGLEQNEDVDTLFEKAEAILFHPEIAELQQEAAALQILLTEFHNDLDPESGKDIAERLIELRKNIEALSDTDISAEFTAPLIELADSMLADDMVQEVIEQYSLVTEESVPDSMELDNLQAAIDFILADPSLSAEERGKKILALLQVSVPTLLESEAVTNDQLVVFLQELQTTLESKDIPLAVPLLEQPAAWETSQSEQLADLILLLSDPEQAEALKKSLQETPEGLELLDVLDRLSETLDLQNIEREVLLEKIHEALSVTRAENAPLAADLLQIMALTHDPQIVSLLPEPLQLAVHSFVQETLPAQYGLVASNIVERIAQVTNGQIMLDFNPPLSLSRADNSIMVLPFLVQPATATQLASLSPEQIPEFLKAISDPVLKEQIQGQIEAIQLLQVIETLRAEDSRLPQISTKTLDALLLKIESDPAFIASIPKDTPEGVAIAEAMERISTVIEDNKGVDRAALTEQIREALISPTPEAASLMNDLKQIISPVSDPKTVGETIEVLSQTIRKDPSFLPSLSNEKQQFVAAIVAKAALVQMATNPALPTTLQKEVRAVLESKNPEKLVQMIQKVLETYPQSQTPREISVLKVVAPVLVSVVKPSSTPETHVKRYVSDPPRSEIRTPDSSPVKQPDAPVWHTSIPPSDPVSPPEREPVRPAPPTNDNPPPEPKPDKPTTPSPAVCPRGGAICLCDVFKNAVEGLKVGDEKKLENGVVLTAEGIRINEDGTTETVYSMKDGAQIVFKGTTEEIEKRIEENVRAVEKDTEKHRDKFEADSTSLSGTNVTALEHQNDITLIQDGRDETSPDITSLDDDFEPDFGDDPTLTTTRPQPTGLAPK